jgi:hypothetical protein
MLPDTRLVIPESCGKFHPERLGHCFTMMEREHEEGK